MIRALSGSIHSGQLRTTSVLLLGLFLDLLRIRIVIVRHVIRLRVVHQHNTTVRGGVVHMNPNVAPFDDIRFQKHIGTRTAHNDSTVATHDIPSHHNEAVEASGEAICGAGVDRHALLIRERAEEPRFNCFRSAREVRELPRSPRLAGVGVRGVVPDVIAFQHFIVDELVAQIRVFAAVTTRPCREPSGACESVLCGDAVQRLGVELDFTAIAVVVAVKCDLANVPAFDSIQNTELINENWVTSQ